MIKKLELVFLVAIAFYLVMIYRQHADFYRQYVYFFGNEEDSQSFYLKTNKTSLKDSFENEEDSQSFYLKTNKTSLKDSFENEENSQSFYLKTNKTSLKENDDPILVLHVGPPKTGTTTLQRGLYRWRKKLLQDSFFYLARPIDASYTANLDQSWKFWDIRSIGPELKQAAIIGAGHNHDFDTRREKASFLKRGQGLDFNRLWDSFKKNEPNKIRRKRDKFSKLVNMMDEFYQQKRNLIISAEQFCFNDRLLPDYNSSWDLFLPPLQKWNVHIVVVYRRFYEYLPSLYFQSTFATLRNENNVTFEAFIDDVMQQAMTLKAQGRWFEAHPTYHAFLKFKRHFANVDIFNIHKTKDKDIVKSFICEILPNAVQTCSFLSSELHTEQKIHRLSKNLDLKLLIKYAYIKKIITADISKVKIHKKIVMEAETYYDKEIKRSLPYKCLPPERLEMIMNMSLAFEEFLLPEWAKLHETQKSHWEGYTEYLDTNKYCEVDFEEALAQQEWQDFFLEVLPEALRLKSERGIIIQKYNN